MIAAEWGFAGSFFSPFPPLASGGVSGATARIIVGGVAGLGQYVTTEEGLHHRPASLGGVANSFIIGGGTGWLGGKFGFGR